MEQLQPNRTYATGCGSRVARVILLLLGVFLLSCPQISWAQEKNVVLPESGIHYPGGFDMNTVGVIQGKAFAFSQGNGGPVQFRLDSGRNIYFVMVSPHWYWKDLKANITDGTEIKIRGSKSLGKDGKLYMIAQEMEILSTGKIYAFRDDAGHPLWTGGRSGIRGTGGGFGSQNRFGGGMSGGGKGRR